MKPTNVQYKIVKSEENDEYISLIESAIDKAEQALGHITYGSFPYVNLELKTKIKDACRILEEALESKIYKVTKE